MAATTQPKILGEFILKEFENESSYQFGSTENATVLRNSTTFYGDFGYSDTLSLFRGIAVLLSLLLGIPGNAFILLSTATNRQLRKNLRNVLLIHLGILGLLQSVLILPWTVFSSLSGYWPNLVLSCKVNGYMDSVLSLATLWTITSICLEKYQSIAHPLHHKAKAERNKVTGVLLTVWTSILTLCALAIYFGKTYIYDKVTGICRFSFYGDDLVMTWISVTLITLTFLVPLLILTICHIRIFIIARSHHRSIAGTLRMITVSVQVPITRVGARRASQPQLPIGRRRAVHTTSYIMGAFVISYLPISVFKMCDILTHNQLNPIWAMLSVLTFQLSPAVNAFVYGLRNRNLRISLVDWYHRKLANYSHRLTLPKKSRKSRRDLSLVKMKLQKHRVHHNALSGYRPSELPVIHEGISEEIETALQEDNDFQHKVVRVLDPRHTSDEEENV